LLEIKVGEHWIENIGGLSVNMDTLITAWIAMAVVIVLAFIITRKLDIVPGSAQAVSEGIMEFIEGIVKGEMGERGMKYVPFIASLFLFIFFANLEGQFPWRLFHFTKGEFASPTNDINTTLGLALTVLVYYIGAGLLEKGFGYFKHYFQPLWFMFPFNLLEDFTRPLSLSLRLFGNILAGELIVLILISLIPILAPVPMMLFELFVAFIQAYIFAVLATSYIGAATSKEH
jgi:F-type H+-transporting ATPase subunit a